MEITVTIQGTTPLLMNRFTEENEIAVGSGRTKIVTGSKGTPRERAEKKAYKDTKGNLYIPGPNIFACIICAGKFHKAGKSKVTTQKSSLIPAGMLVIDTVCSLDTKDFEVDSRSVVIPSTGGRIMCHRPRLDKWKFAFTIDLFDDELFDEAFVRTLIDDAGKKIGLGDFRPDRKGPFGRFVVVDWQVKKEALAA